MYVRFLICWTSDSPRSSRRIVAGEGTCPAATINIAKRCVFERILQVDRWTNSLRYPPQNGKSLRQLREEKYKWEVEIGIDVRKNLRESVWRAKFSVYWCGDVVNARECPTLPGF